jgi:glycosyltransferase involved in cell wall biosynthesis
MGSPDTRDPLSVCVLTEYFNPGGAGGTPTVIPELCRHIAAHYPWCRLEVLTSRNVYRGDGRRLAAREEWEGIPVRRMATPASNRRSTAWRLACGLAFAAAATWRLLVGPRYDLVFVGTNPPPGVAAACLLRRLRGVPYVYLIHDLFPDIAISTGAIGADGRVAKVSRAFQRRWLNRAAQVVVIGRCMRSHIVQTYGVPLERVKVIPNWADAEAIRPGPRDNAFRRENGLGGFVALYAGNLGLYQDLDTMLDAAKMLMSAGCNATLVLAGNGAREEHIRERVRTEGLSNVRVLALIPADRYPMAVAAADVCIVTLHPKSFGLGVPSKFYGLLAAGRPVIAMVPEGSEVAKVVEEEMCGIRVDPGDAEGLANAIARLQSCPAEAEEMGGRGRSALERRFTLDAAASEYVRTLEQAMLEEVKV